MKTILFLVIFVICSFPPDVNGQSDSQTNLRYKKLFKVYAPFSEVTGPIVGDMHFNNGLTNYILTAQVEPHFFLSSQGKSKFAFDFYFGIDVRILRETSLPVRTPSTRPGVTFYWPTQFVNNPSYADYLTLGIMHFSNGQDGCTLNGYNYNLDDECIQTRVLLPNEKIFNQYNGSFSTNFFEFGYNLSKEHSEIPVRRLSNYISPFGKRTYHGDRLHYFYLGYQHHFLNIEPGLRGRYGLQRLVFKYKRITSVNWENSPIPKYEADRLLIRWTTNLSKVDKLPNFKFHNRIVFDAKYYFTWKKLSSNSTNFFIMGGYKGQDEYNIYLEDDFFYAGFGLSVGNILYSIN